MEWHERNHPGGVEGCKANLADAIAAREALNDTPENHRVGYVGFPYLETRAFAGSPPYIQDGTADYGIRA